MWDEEDMKKEVQGERKADAAHEYHHSRGR